jgi:hypothetical protein
MPTEPLFPCAYRILRYTPNLIRDEWVNIGVVLLDPAGRRARVRCIEDAAEFARIRRLHPNADEPVLRALGSGFEARFAANGGDPQATLAMLDETLSNVLQLSPQRGVLAEDFDAELDRLYRDHVEPPRLRRTAEAGSRAGIRLRMRSVFRSAGILGRLRAGVRVDEFTFRGDPFHLDFAYQRNGTRGFVHALPLARDAAPAKVLAFTAERVRARLASAEFTAVTEAEPQPGDARQAFIAGLLAEQNVSLLPVARLEEFAGRIGPQLGHA